MERVRQGEVTTEDASVQLISVNYNLIEELTVENSYGRFDFRNGDDGWKMASGEMPTDPDSIAVYALMASDISASDTVRTDVSDLSIYGLSNPIRVTVKTPLEQRTLLIGGLTPTEETFYVKTEDSDTVYALGPNKYTKDPVQLGKLFASNVMSIVMSKDYFPDEDFNYLLFERGGEVVVETDKREDLQWYMTRPIAIATEGTGLSVVLLSLRDAQSVSYIGKDVTPEQLEEFGLTSPRYTITYRTDSGKSRTVLLGADSSSTCVYALDRDTGVVVTLSKEKLDFLDKKTVELVSCIVYLQSINDHSRLTVSGDGDTKDLQITYDPVTKDAVSNIMNGAEITAGDATAFYSKILSALKPSDIDAEAQPSGEPAVTVRLERTDGTVVTFGYTARVNGGDGKVYDYYLMRDGEYTGILIDAKAVEELK